MPEKRNEWTEAKEAVAADLIRGRKEAEKSRAVPFMEERIPLDQARIRWAKMPPEQRRAFIGKHGLEAAMRLVRPPKTGPSFGETEES